MILFQFVTFLLFNYALYSSWVSSLWMKYVWINECLSVWIDGYKYKYKWEFAERGLQIVKGR